MNPSFHRRICLIPQFNCCAATSTMSSSVHFITGSIPGYGPPDSSHLPCSGISGSLSSRSSYGQHKLAYNAEVLSLRRVSRYTSFVCNARSSNYRRNPDFSKQSRHGYSRHRNRPNETREKFEDIEESETLASKNGPVFSVSGNQRYQATATTGPREKEIVELFRKVQARLRERAAVKEGKKVEESQAKSKESETVDSLLKLLRKHSVQQGKKSNTTASTTKDFILDQDEQIIPLAEERTKTTISDSTAIVERETQESPRPELSRPKSNFQKRSPVPEIKFQPVESVDSRRKWSSMEPEAYEEIHDVEYDSDSDEEDPLTSEVTAFDEIAEDKASEIDENEKEEAVVEASNMREMKLTELRALAKSRGMKGFSKLKKNDLVEVLCGGSI